MTSYEGLSPVTVLSSTTLPSTLTTTLPLALAIGTETAIVSLSRYVILVGTTVTVLFNGLTWNNALAFASL